MIVKGSEPDVTVVTVNLNNREGLERTIRSLWQLEVRDFQYVVIDGASSDGSVDLAHANADIIDYFVSEPDSGIYNAMNKARPLAQGRYLLFLNSGDYFANPHALNDLNLQSGEDLIYGNHTYHDPVTGRTGLTEYNGVLDLGFFWRTTIPQCSTFIRRSCLDAGDWFDEDYPIAADWVFFCRAVLERLCSTRPLNRAVSVFELGGVSTTESNAEIVRQERDRFMRALLPGYVYDFMGDAESIRQDNVRLVRELKTLEKVLDEYKRKRIRFRGAQLMRRVQSKLTPK